MSGRTGGRAVPVRVARILGAALGVALSARLAVALPGTPVPQTAQTLAVLLAGAALGARDGALAVAAYVLAGAFGLPVFADGSGGAERLVGPTAGYLAGFVLAAAAVGRAAEGGRLRRWPGALGTMLGAHALILLLGWLRLAFAAGAAAAFTGGVAPFLVGGAVKALIAAGVGVALARRGDAGAVVPARQA